jgi:hypothetical protein
MVDGLFDGHSSLPPLPRPRNVAITVAASIAADHLAREPLDYLAAEGFEIEQLERSKWGIVERVRARAPGRSR